MSQPRHFSAAAPSIAGFLAPRAVALLAAAALLTVGPASASPVQTLESIRAAASAYAAELHPDEDVELDVGRLDPRLRLAQCEQTLSTFSTSGHQRPGHLTVGVRCEGARPWTLYVPVRVNSYVDVLTLAQSVPRGSVLTVADLVPLRASIATLPHGYFTEAAEVIGMEVRRPLRAGEIVAPNAIAQPRMISRGQEVRLVADSGGISVSARAEALQDGARGQRIQVRNLSSRRVVEAEVTAAGEVRARL
jgi:flagellar basal body P-ring formation protein FlgA